jgi:hypothetical protein
VFELLAVVNGLLLGVIAGQYRATTRVRLVLLVCIAGGILVSMSGFLSHPEPSLFAIDVLLVSVSATVGFFSARRLTIGRRG